MIKIVEGCDRSPHAALIDQMHRMRARVFSDGLGWDVEVRDGREVDRFDAEDPLYLLSLDEHTGQLQGSVRLLSTTAPNILRDVFPVLLDGETVQSSLIWESFRFAINPDLSKTQDDANHVVSRTTTELLCGIVEVCQYAALPMLCRSMMRAWLGFSKPRIARLRCWIRLPALERS